jgi:hypothetical protein
MVKLLAVNTFFEPDAVAEHQFLRVYGAKNYLLPEERLMFGVLNDAIDCLDKHRHSTRRRSRKICQETLNWIVSRDRDTLFSFENICETLRIDPGYLRMGLLRWLGTERQPSHRLRVHRTPLRYLTRVMDFRIAS